jgi:hypothetical protein
VIAEHRPPVVPAEKVDLAEQQDKDQSHRHHDDRRRLDHQRLDVVGAQEALVQYREDDGDDDEADYRWDRAQLAAPDAGEIVPGVGA